MFEIGKVYRRVELHDEYGGQRQGGIVTPTGRPYILLITGEGGEAHGYADGWEDESTFRYYGEGQLGDMQFVRGNAAIRDHAERGKDLHLFEKVPPAHLRYRGQMLCAGYDLAPNSPDTAGNPRSAIVFRLVSLTSDSNTTYDGAIPGDSDHPPSWYWEQPLNDLRAGAMDPPSANLTPTQARRTIYHRSEAVRVYVLRRAKGTCEGCETPAPFLTADGRPYLEPHHTRRLSDGGPDHPAWVVALCPTCHRRAHHAADHLVFNGELITKVNALEGLTAAS